MNEKCNRNLKKKKLTSKKKNAWIADGKNKGNGKEWLKLTKNSFQGNLKTKKKIMKEKNKCLDITQNII